MLAAVDTDTRGYPGDVVQLAEMGYKALNEYNIQKKTKSHGNLLRYNDLLGHLGAEVGIKRISIHR